MSVGDFGVRVLLERGVRQPDRAEEVGLVVEVVAQAGVDLIERAFRRDEDHQSARPHLLDALREEVIVNRESCGR